MLVTGAELFTGNTMTTTAAFHEKKLSVADVLKSWIVSFIGNFIGSLAIASLVAMSGVGAGLPSAMAVAKAKTSLPFLQVWTGLKELFEGWIAFVKLDR